MDTANILSTPPSSEEDNSESMDEGSPNYLLDSIYIDTYLPNFYMLTLKNIASNKLGLCICFTVLSYGNHMQIIYIHIYIYI